MTNLLIFLKFRKTSFFPVCSFLAIIVLCTGNLLAQDGETELSRSEINEFVEKASQYLIEDYVFKDIGEEVAEHITRRLKEGAYDTISTKVSFASVMTDEIQSISHDKHMRVRLRQQRQPIYSNSDPLVDQYLQTLQGHDENFGFLKVEVIENNIGYVDFRYFASPSQAEDRVAAVMAFLKYANALIFDVRQNGGGNPEMVQLICSYLFNKKIHLNSLYWREGDRIVEYWTLDEVDGDKMPELPVYVLTSNRTFSGAEEFTYNLKTRKRATIIGETTGGGANPGGVRSITEHFGLFIPTGRAINPVTGTNWEGTGVEPDIKVSADSALVVALEEAGISAQKYRDMKIDKAKSLIAEINSTEVEVEKLIRVGKMSEATDTFFKILDLGKEQKILTEMNINRLGYDYLRQNKYETALIVFKYNVKAYPGAFNTYDSLGEAYMKLERKEQAIQNYEKSLELNPKNNNAINTLEKLRDN